MVLQLYQLQARPAALAISRRVLLSLKVLQRLRSSVLLCSSGGTRCLFRTAGMFVVPFAAAKWIGRCWCASNALRPAMAIRA